MMEKITIEVNGEQVELTEFPSVIITNTIKGMLKSLRGVDEIKSVVIKIENEEK